MAVNIHVKRSFSRNLYNFWRKVKRDKFLLLIFAPGALYFLIFKYLPMAGIVMAFQDYNIWLGFFKSPWVGLAQFQDLFTSPQFYTILKNTILLNLYGWVLGFPLPIIFALALNECRQPKIKKVTQTISYLPHFISVVVIAGMVTEFLSPSSGFISKGIGTLLNIDPPYILGEAKYFSTVYVLTTVWQGFGWGAIVYLAALAGVDIELYDACIIDGASRFQRIRYITFPSILPTVVIMLIMSLGSLMSSGFDLIYLLQNDLNLSTSEVISTFVYKRGILGMGGNILPNYSYATAVNLFQSVVNMALVVTANYISRKVSDISLW